MSESGSDREEVSQHFRRLMELDAVKAAFSKLENELPSYLKFHTLGHTVDVFGEAIAFAIHDDLPLEELDRIAIAAAFHDTGFIDSAQAHEERSCGIARSVLSSLEGFSEAVITEICDMIMDTQKLEAPEGGMVFVPRTRLAGYLLDADVSNLGRPDFFDKLFLLVDEYGVDRNKFLSDTLKFLHRHKWHTPAAKKLRTEGKNENIRKLEALIAENQE